MHLKLNILQFVTNTLRKKTVWFFFKLRNVQLKKEHVASHKSIGLMGQSSSSTTSSEVATTMCLEPLRAIKMFSSELKLYWCLKIKKKTQMWWIWCLQCEGNSAVKHFHVEVILWKLQQHERWRKNMRQINHLLLHQSLMTFMVYYNKDKLYVYIDNCTIGIFVSAKSSSIN